MLSTILDIILDALLDSAKMLPFLYLTFLLMEFIEHHAADKLALALEKAGHSNIGGLRSAMWIFHCCIKSVFQQNNRRRHTYGCLYFHLR